MRKYTLWSAMVALVLALAACGGGGAANNTGGNTTGSTGGEETTAAVQELALEGGNELKYNPEAISASVGDVNITLNNTGALEHNIIWEEGGDPAEPFVYTTGGETASNTRTFDAPGDYGFYCSIPGHREAGMVGTLTITE